MIFMIIVQNPVENIPKPVENIHIIQLKISQIHQKYPYNPAKNIRKYPYNPARNIRKHSNNPAGEVTTG